MATCLALVRYTGACSKRISPVAEAKDIEAEIRTQLADSVMKRWAMLHTDLHAAGFILDPEFQQFLQHENEEVINGFHAMVERVFPDDIPSQVKAIEQHSSYGAGHGLFGRPMAVAAAKQCLDIDGGLHLAQEHLNFNWLLPVFWLRLC